MENGLHTKDMCARSFELSRPILNIGQGQMRTSIRIFSTGVKDEKRNEHVYLKGHVTRAFCSWKRQRW